VVDDEWLSVECQYISQSFIIGQYVRLGGVEMMRSFDEDQRSNFKLGSGGWFWSARVR